MTLPTVKSLLIVALILSSTGLFAQDYYVVIGAYRVQKYADAFTGYARNAKYDAQQGVHEQRKLTYIYVLKTSDKKEASAMTRRLQKETEFEDTWLYEGPLTTGEPTQPIVKQEPKEEKIPVVEPKVEPVVVIKEEPKEEPRPEPKEEPKEEPVDVDKPLPPARGKYFKFIVTTQDGQELSTSVHNVDRMQGRDLATYKTNEYVDVTRPVDPSMPLSIVCGVFGFAEVVKIIDFNDPSQTADATQDEKGAWVIPFKLERLKKGDVSIMYDVAFYKDASVMTPASKTELDELVNMMRMNPNYRIKIHGHNNGNDKNIRITTLGKDKNYFAMAGSSTKNGNGKELSKLRAETIQSYLVDNGIDKKRTEIYAWGGMEMLVKQGSNVAAKLNNRIEIEILQD
ncbi:MAG: OmpA family protein [Cyclobacteriaceae bacterium]|nr:OmpA family protein [Cyclobacteriaceae bacterium]